MRLDIHEHIDVCQSCAEHNPIPLRKAPILSYPVPRAPWDAVAIDILKLPLTESGNEYLLVIMDHFSRFCILVPLPDKSAKTVARAIVDELICKFGSPKSLLSDNGGEFNNAILEEICGNFNIKKCNITPYHPASNGLVERQNRKVLNSLRHMITPTSHSWDKSMPMVASTLNSSINKSTKETPHFIIFGTDKRLPYSVLSVPSKPVYNLDDFAKTRLHDFQKIHQYVQMNLTASKEEMLDQQHRIAKNINLELGDIVFEINQTRESKLDKRFCGPFRVIEIGSGHKVKVLGLQSLDTKTIHKDLLKKVSREFDNHVEVPTEPSSSPSEPSSTNTYKQKLRSYRPVSTVVSDEEIEKHLQDLNVNPSLFYR